MTEHVLNAQEALTVINGNLEEQNRELHELHLMSTLRGPYPKLILHRHIEVPCGWFCIYGLSSDGNDFHDLDLNEVEGHALILNRWNGKIVDLDRETTPSWQACVRDYMSRLPLEQQFACRSVECASRWTQEPVRFIPSLWDIGYIANIDALDKLTFELEVDDQLKRYFDRSLPDITGTAIYPGINPADKAGYLGTPWIIDCKIIDIRATNTGVTYVFKPIFDIAKFAAGRHIIDRLVIAYSGEQDVDFQKAVSGVWLSVRGRIVSE